jgi:hypothetical protein
MQPNDSSHQLKPTSFCVCCLGAFKSLGSCADRILQSLREKRVLHRPIAITLDMSPAFDMTRVICRNVAFGTTNKIAPFPQFSDIFPSTIEMHLKTLCPGIKLVNLSTAEVKVEVSVDYGNKGDTIALCTTLYPEFHYKKKRVMLGQTTTENKFEINQTQADQVLIAVRGLSIGTCSVCILRTFLPFIKTFSENLMSFISQGRWRSV